MTDSPSKVHQNYWAIAVAAIACFLFEAVWYSIFMKPWLNGIGHTREWLESAAGYHPTLQFGTALVAAAVMAAAISRVTQYTGPQTAMRGIKVAAMLWGGFVLTTWTTEYVFEVRPLSLYAINEGFWLLGMILMGAIVGGWKKKVR
jgi:uncharacterized protein DUF1761